MTYVTGPSATSSIQRAGPQNPGAVVAREPLDLARRNDGRRQQRGCDDADEGEPGARGRRTEATTTRPTASTYPTCSASADVASEGATAMNVKASSAASWFAIERQEDGRGCDSEGGDRREGLGRGFHAQPEHEHEKSGGAA
jgi:hypothetical protein